MLKSGLPLLLTLLLATAALAEPAEKVVGHAIDVKGLVTVSNGVEVAGVLEGSDVFNGTRYVTSSIGWVTLKFEHCEVRLRPSQTLVVDERRCCDDEARLRRGQPHRVDERQCCDAMIAAIESLEAPLPVVRDPLLAATILGGGILAIRGGGQSPVNPNLSGQ